MNEVDVVREHVGEVVLLSARQDSFEAFNHTRRISISHEVIGLYVLSRLRNTRWSVSATRTVFIFIVPHAAKPVCYEIL